MYGLSDSCNFLDALVLVYLFMKWKGDHFISLSHASQCEVFLVIWWVKYSLNWGVEIYLTILEHEIFFPDGSCTIGIIVVNAEHKYHRTNFRQYMLLTSKDGQPERDCGRPRNRRKYWGSQEGVEFNMKVICKCWWRWTGSRMGWYT